MYTPPPSGAQRTPASLLPRAQAPSAAVDTRTTTAVPGVVPTRAAPPTGSGPQVAVRVVGGPKAPAGSDPVSAASASELKAGQQLSAARSAPSGACSGGVPPSAGISAVRASGPGAGRSGA